MSDEQAWRYRVNVSRTSTGKYSFDCTVEASGDSETPITMGEVLNQSDRLVEALNGRYFPRVEPEKAVPDAE